MDRKDVLSEDLVHFDIEKNPLHHKFILPSKSIVKLINSPIIHVFPFGHNYVVGVYRYEGNLIPIISLANFFEISQEQSQSIENLLILETNNDLIAFCNILNMEYIESSTVEENQNFNRTTNLIFTDKSVIIAEYYLSSLEIRGYLIDIDILNNQLEDDIHEKSKIITEKTSMDVSTINISQDHTPLVQPRDEYLPEHVPKGSKSSVDELFVLFKIEDQKYGLSANFIQSVLNDLYYRSNTNLLSDHYLGIVRTIYGSANVYDLRLFFNITPDEYGQYLVISDDDTYHIFIVDEILDVSTINQYDINQNIYPITNTDETFYKGVLEVEGEESYELVFILDDRRLIHYLENDFPQLLGEKCQYQFEPLDEKIEKQITAEEQISWFGSRVRLGISLQFVEKIIHNIDLDQFSNDEQIFDVDIDNYGEIPVIDLQSFFQIRETGTHKLAILDVDQKLFGLAFPGDIRIESAEKLGNMEDYIYNGIVIDQEKKFIVDYSYYEDFIGFLINPNTLAQYLIEEDYALLEKELEEETGNYKNFVLIENRDHENYLFSLEELDRIEKAAAHDVELYSFDEYIKGNLTEYDGVTLPLISLKIKDKDHWFLTDGNMNIIQIYEDDMSELFQADVEEGKQIQLPEDKMAKYVKLR